MDVAGSAPELTAPATHLFISPHYDDIALSCGGTAALVSEGVAVRVFDIQARVRLFAPANEALMWIGPTVGVVEHVDDSTCIVTIGGDPDWIARYLVGLPVPFEVIEPDTVRHELRLIANQLLTQLGS